MGDVGDTSSVQRSQPHRAPPSPPPIHGTATVNEIAIHLNYLVRTVEELAASVREQGETLIRTEERLNDYHRRIRDFLAANKSASESQELLVSVAKIAASKKEKTARHPPLNDDEGKLRDFIIQSIITIIIGLIMGGLVKWSLGKEIAEQIHAGSP